MINLILEAKEQRQVYLKFHLEYGYAIISIKSNLPGFNKHRSEAYFLCRLFFNEIKLLYKDLTYELLSSSDGPWIFVKFKHQNVVELKKELINIEETHPLGRYIDLDVHQENQSISRQMLGLHLRKCYLCELDAITCQRLNHHHEDDLITHIQLKIHEYLIKEITNLINDSILYELNLEDKFGLVTKTSSGSHHDMDYELMIKAKDAIVPHLLKIFFLGYESNDITHLLQLARQIGLVAETDMLHATRGINSYKGLIFVLGLSLLSFGVALNTPSFEPNTRDYIRFFSKDLLREFEFDQNTFGKKVYQQYQIDGVRGEAHRGFPSIYQLIEQYQFDHDLSDSTLRFLLKSLILSTNDTVFLKRAGSLEHYQHILDQLKKLDTNNPIEVKNFTEYAIKNHLSFGGSADLLITYIFMKLFQQHFLI
jgi:holo-ACP synthase/triphosphoribosyl-dephospho-CoA synthase